MVIYAYSLPALLAFIFKIVLLVYWRCPFNPSIAARLFMVAVIVSVSLNGIEIGGFQGLFGSPPSEAAARLYHVVLMVLLAVLTHLTFEVTFDEPPTFVRRWLIPILYLYGFALGALIAGTTLIMARFDVLGGYTLTRVPGPLYPLCEIFAAGTLFTIMLLPLRAVRNPSGRLRSRCRIWALAAAPACLLVIIVLALLRLDLQFFNATVTLPIPMALLLYAIGYCIHSKQLVDPFAYFPFSKVRPSKRALHASLAEIASRTPEKRDELLQRLSLAIGCEIYLVDTFGVVAKSGGAESTLQGVPFDTIQETLLTLDAKEPLKEALRQQRVGAIIPLFATSEKIRNWLVFGAAFDANIYTPSDFHLLNKVVKTLAGLLLDQHASAVSDLPVAHLLKVGVSGPNDPGRAAPLSLRLAAYEAFLITEALKLSKGNKAKAARLLGLQPNTLHYKMERHGLEARKQ